MIASLIIAAALMSAGEPDGVIVTAPVGAGSVPAETTITATSASPSATVQQTPHGLTTQQQIDRWMGASDEGLAPFEEAGRAGGPAFERRIHGEVSAAIGSHDYRGYSASVDVPIGESGWLSLSYSKSEGGPDYYHGGYPGDGFYDPYGPYAYGAPRIGAPGKITSEDRR